MSTQFLSPLQHSTLSVLDDLALYRASGDDAASFLHGQLTNDVTGLPSDRAALAGYCTPKGRVLATLVYWRQTYNNEPCVYLLLKKDLAESVIRRLSMFVLRAKVSFQAVPLSVFGLNISTSETALPAFLESAKLWQYHADDHEGTYIRVPDSRAQRWWWIPSTNGDNPSPHEHLAREPLEAWQAADIRAGLPWIQAATQDIFIPQTLNLDLINGVSFTKGCYPGQEVVARAHYRGTVKRRMAFARAALPAGTAQPEPGSDIFKEGQADPCGRVVNAALESSHDGVDNTIMLLELQLADAQSGALRLGRPDGAVLTLQALPYPLSQ